MVCAWMYQSVMHSKESSWWHYSWNRIKWRRRNNHTTPRLSTSTYLLQCDYTHIQRTWV